MRGAPSGLAICAVAACLVAGLARASADDAARDIPDATISFRGRNAAVGVGFSWGAASVEFQGKTYPVRVDGFVLGGLGGGSIQGSGQIFGLDKIEDLGGDYTALVAGATLHRGTGSLVMRNDKGVRIVIDATSTGLGVGVGPRGITLSVGEAGGEPADESARLPQTLGFGEIKAGPVFLRPTLNAQFYGAVPINAGFDGDWSFGPVDQVNGYFEHSNEAGLNIRYPMGEAEDYGTLLGRISGVFTLTAGGPDGPVCNDGETTSEYTLESGYLAWKSGNLVPALGYNAIELSGGNQNYQVFDGLLFWDGAGDCEGRGANWLSPRRAFRETGILRIGYEDLTVEGVHLAYHDQPDTDTRLAAARIEIAKEDVLLKHLKLGLMYFNLYESDTATRDGMDGLYTYTEATPLSALPDFSYKASFVWEHNSSSSGLTNAFGWYVAPAYEFSSLPWTPTLGYRYASFSGGSTKAFDPLFTGLTDWGSWFQGELLGEYVLSNSNLISHQVRLTFEPTDAVTVNLIYYKFRLDDADQDFGLASARVDHSLADEVDLIVDVAMTNWWSITATLSVARPNRGFREAVGESKTWFNGYLYMNFNF